MPTRFMDEVVIALFAVDQQLRLGWLKKTVAMLTARVTEEQ